MSLDERVQWFILGCIVGFFIGYIIRYLREIKDELDEVDAIVKTDHEYDPRKDRGERGAISWRSVRFKDIALLLVVCVTFYAAIASQRASNDADGATNQLKDATARLQTLTNCNRIFLGTTLDALHERTTFATVATQKNIKLQTSFATLLAALLHHPPPTPNQSEDAVDKYVNDLNEFIKVSNKSVDKVKHNPYPTIKQFTDCLNTVPAKEINTHE